MPLKLPKLSFFMFDYKYSSKEEGGEGRKREEE